MKKINKFLSILLATILILSAFPVSLAYATDNPITFSAQADAESAKAGDIVSVDVCMSENSVVAALTLVVDYDNTALKILNVQSKQAFGYEEFNTAFDGNKLAYLTASANPKTVGGTLFTVQFEVLKEGCAEISLTVNELTDIDFKTLSSSTQSAKIHNYDNGTVTPPTCVDKGYTTYACECGYSYQTDETDAKGHNFVNGTCTECGEKSVKWKFDEETGTLTIYGTGPMEDYGYNNRPWESYVKDIKTVVIEDGVISIGSYAFAECSALTSVTIPDSVIIIGECAFAYCESLINITIPDSVKVICQYAFALCKSLTSAIIPDGVTSIYSGVFCYCTSLTSVTIPDSVTVISEGAFLDCTSLTDVYYSNSAGKLNDISIDSDNESLLNARIHCNSTGADTHPFNPVVTPPTCTDQGFTTYTCACGYSNDVVDNYVDATGHSHTSEITTPATHLVTGVMTFTCHCGDTYTEIIEKTTEHNHEAVVTPPTCTEQGFTTYTCECGDTYVADYVNANGHSYNPVVTPPTCTEGGYTTYTCACGDTYVSDETSATGHSYEEKITTAPTHTENGVMTYTCVCGDTYTESIDATGDHYHVPSVTSPTCTEGGYTTYTCVCGDTYVADETSATGHDYDYDNGVLMRPTETTNGCYVYFCKNDTNHRIFEEVESADYTEYDKAIEKLGEYLSNSNLTPEAKEFIVSECVKIIQNNDEFYESGIKERRNLIASEQHIIDKVTNELNEHFEVVDNFIANCESGNHDVREYVSDDNATCTVNGTKRGACYYCGAEVVVDDENNPASGHDIVVDNAVAPDCVNTGLTEGSHCSRCDGATTEQEVVPALGHSYNSVVTSPTCTEGGYTTYTCACGDSYVDDETSAIGHSFSNGSCTVCGDADPDYYVFSVKSPSKTKIRNKDGIILHTEIDGNAPTGSYVKWTASNGNFDKTVMNNGSSLRVIANNNGYTTFTATLYDAEGNELAKDTVELYSQSGFFDKIGGFFRSLFGTTKIYEN